MNSVKVRFDGRVFVPEQPVDLPAGFELVISLPTSRAETPEDDSGQATMEKLLEIGERYPANPDLPTDLAAQHDHYLYGTPKRP